MYTRIALFLCVICAGLFLPIWAFIVVSIVYALLYTAYEIAGVGLCIDITFGNIAGDAWYMYTLASLIIVIISLYIKPYLRFY